MVVSAGAEAAFCGAGWALATDEAGGAGGVGSGVVSALAGAELLATLASAGVAGAALAVALAVAALSPGTLAAVFAWATVESSWVFS